MFESATNGESISAEQGLNNQLKHLTAISAGITDKELAELPTAEAFKEAVGGIL